MAASVLRGACRALRPGGRLWVDVNHLPWLLDAGFAEVHGSTDRGEELTTDAPRMVLVAHA